jgi:hypothetical protein
MIDLNDGGASSARMESNRGVLQDSGSPGVKYAVGAIKAWAQFLIWVYFLSFAINLLSFLPDLDQALLPILHHRSIITHSILLPVLVLVVLRNRYVVLQSVLFAAFAIHLSADLISPPVGFGAIWLPAPLKISLGLLSPLWIVLNAVSAFYIYFKISVHAREPWIFWSIALAGVVYGTTNEGNVVAILAILTLLALAIWPFLRTGQICFSPAERYAEAKKAYLNNRQWVVETRRKKKAERAAMSQLKRSFLNTRDAVAAAVRYVTAPFRYPKRSAVVFLAIVVFYIAGFLASDGSSGGVVSTVAKGAWVIHSAGGCILVQSGQYVAGTYTADLSMCSP